MTRPKQQNIVGTQRELALQLDKGEGTIVRWKKEGMPVEADGSFDVIRIAAWDKARKDTSARARERAADELEYWTSELKRFQAMKAEIELHELEGKLVDKAEVETNFAQWAAALSKRFMELGRRMAQELVGHDEPREVQRIVEGHIREVLDDISATGVIAG